MKSNDYNKSQNKEYINEFEYNLNTKNKGPIQNHFPFPPLIDLNNIGTTCYMNTTLQCFCHIQQFVEFFKYSNQIIELVKNVKTKL